MRIKRKLEDALCKSKFIIIFLSFFLCTFSFKYIVFGNIRHSSDFSYLIFLIYFFYFVKTRKKPGIDAILMLAYYSWVLFEQIKSDFALGDFYYTISALTIVILIETYSKDEKELIQALMLLFEFYIYINFATILINNMAGKTKELTFLGVYNTGIIYMIVAIGISLFHIKYFGNKTRGTILICVSLLSMVLCASITPKLTAIIILLTFAFLVFFLRVFRKKDVSLIFLFSLTIIVSIFLIFIYSRNIDSFPVLGNIIIKIFGKRPTLTGRTEIWANTVDAFLRTPIIGYGDFPYITYDIRVAAHAHNEYLNIAVQYGVIGLAIYLSFVLRIIKKIDNMKNILYKYAFISLFFGLFSAQIVESYGISHLLLIIYLLISHFCERL